jgi:predicted nucleotidyltransferase
MEQELLKRVKTVVREIEPDAEIYLYGSRARQDSRKDSDWDFLILVDGAVDAARTDRIRHLIYEIELEIGNVLSSIVKNRQEWNSPRYRYVPLREAIQREGIPV